MVSGTHVQQLSSMCSDEGLARCLQVNLRAAFSRYAITPARGISFGPVMYNTSSKPRSFDITNMGDFPITLKIFNLALGLVSHTPWHAGRVFCKASGKVLGLLKNRQCRPHCRCHSDCLWKHSIAIYCSSVPTPANHELALVPTGCQHVRELCQAPCAF